MLCYWGSSRCIDPHLPGDDGLRVHLVFQEALIIDCIFQDVLVIRVEEQVGFCTLEGFGVLANCGGGQQGVRGGRRGFMVLLN